jgi:hypothetical protein
MWSLSKGKICILDNMEMCIVVELTETMHTFWYLMCAHKVLYMNKLL